MINLLQVGENLITHQNGEPSLGVVHKDFVFSWFTLESEEDGDAVLEGRHLLSDSAVSLVGQASCRNRSEE